MPTQGYLSYMRFGLEGLAYVTYLSVRARYTNAPFKHDQVVYKQVH